MGTVSLKIIMKENIFTKKRKYFGTWILEQEKKLKVKRKLLKI